MDRDRWLSTVSAAQLSIGVAGMGLALKRHHPYHLPLLHGRPDKVGRDSLLMGTALSAPVVMLVTQAVAGARLRRGSQGNEGFVLGALGTMMVPGYLAETHVRHRLRRSGWDRVESPLLLAGIALAAGMVGLGLTGGRAGPIGRDRSARREGGSRGPARR